MPSARPHPLTVPTAGRLGRRSTGRRGLLLPLAATLVAALAPSVSSASPSPQSPASTTPPAPARTATLPYGPIVLPPAVAGQPGTVAGLVPNISMPCSNCFLTGTEVDLVYADGRSANLDTGVMLHHLVVFNSGRPDATCGPETPVGTFGERFFAAGNERTAGTLPAGFGYHLGDEPVNAVIEIMNHSEEMKTVWFSAGITHVPDSTPNMKPVTPLWLDENNCSTSQYSVPAGASNRVWRWTSSLTGRLIAAGGHVHDYGIKTALSNESTGEQLCTSYAGYGTNPAYMGTLESMTTCIWDRLGTVRAGEVLALDTYYDSPSARDDVMGIMLAYLYETDDLTGGTPAPPQAAPPSAGRPSPAPGHHH